MKPHKRRQFLAKGDTLKRLIAEPPVVAQIDVYLSSFPVWESAEANARLASEWI